MRYISGPSFSVRVYVVFEQKQDKRLLVRLSKLLFVPRISFHSQSFAIANTSVCGADALPRRFDEADEARNLHDVKNHGGASASATRRVRNTLFIAFLERA